MWFFTWFVNLIRGNRPKKVKTAQDSSPLVDPEHPPGYCEKDPINSKQAGSIEEVAFPSVFKKFLKTPGPQTWGPPSAYALADQWDILTNLPGLDNIPLVCYPKRVAFFLKILTHMESSEGEITLEEVRKFLEC